MIIQETTKMSEREKMAARNSNFCYLLNALYPVGSIYVSKDPTDPAELFGGSWKRIKERFIWAIGDNENPGDTGGEKTHTLSVDEMPSHNHSPSDFDVNGNWVPATDAMSRNRYNIDSTGTRYIPSGDSLDDWKWGKTSSVGGSQPHNNMPPWEGFYIWERIESDVPMGGSAGMLLADQTYNPESANAQSGIAVAQAINGEINDENYFEITEDGIISLKPEYRGACPSNRSQYVYAISDNGLGNSGSKNDELPDVLYIPKILNYIPVIELADGMFLYNSAIRKIYLPKGINVISERFCDNAVNIENIYNTENVTTIEKTAFQETKLKEAFFPELTSLGTGAFNQCPYLVNADIGTVTVIPQQAFGYCEDLCLLNSGAISSVGVAGFFKTQRLRVINIQNCKSFGNTSMIYSRYNIDFNSLPSDCTFGTNATSKQINPNDIWTDRTFTACENEIPTLLSQDDPRWVNRMIGTSGKYYGSDGCIFMCLMHIYCGLHNLQLNTVQEFEEILNNINPNLINSFTALYADIKVFAEGMGLTVERYEEYTAESLQAVYDSLADDGYLLAAVPSTSSNLYGHAVTIYGIDNNQNLLVADSTSTAVQLGAYRSRKYSIPYQNFILPSDNSPQYDNWLVNIISLPKIISFKVIGVGTYSAKKGMTWQEWCDSSYNTDGFYCSGENVYSMQGQVYLVTADDIILENNQYEIIL